MRAEFDDDSTDARVLWVFGFCQMGGDPAVTSSPVLATLTDIIGVIVLCVISSKMLADVL